MKLTNRLFGAAVCVVALGLLHEGMASGSSPGVPHLPSTPYNYTELDLPAHFGTPDRDEGRRRGRGRGVLRDNSPADNPVTDDGATLGRVLFYDVRLSGNDTVSCGTCHLQEHGFSDPKRFSRGLHGELTERHSMGLANARYYARDRFFWDERANGLEEQVLMPIQDAVEMDMSLDVLEAKLGAEDFYPPLFEAAFGSPDVTTDRISRALAQFVRSLVSYESKYDQALSAREPGGSLEEGMRTVLSDEEMQGFELFNRGGGGRGRGGDGGGRGGAPQAGGGGFDDSDRNRGVGCSRCHSGVVQVSSPRNNGLDRTTRADEGAGDGRFKAPSLRNIAVRPPYMHDGRFDTLREVIEHYNSGVQPHPELSREMTGRGRAPQRLNLSNREIDALIVFLETLTDESFLSDPKFSDPFAQ